MRYIALLLLLGCQSDTYTGEPYDDAKFHRTLTIIDSLGRVTVIDTLSMPEHELFRDSTGKVTGGFHRHNRKR